MTREEMVLVAKQLGMGAKQLGLKIEAKRLGGKHLGGETSCYQTESRQFTDKTVHRHVF